MDRGLDYEHDYDYEHEHEHDYEHEHEHGNVMVLMKRAAKKKRKEPVRRRLRRAGYVFFVIALLLLLAAWNTGTNLYYLVFGGVASFIAFSAVLARWSLRGLHLRRDAPGAVHRGASLGVEVRIENRKRVLPCVSVRVESVRAGGQPGPSGGYILILPARRAASLRMTEQFDRRGVYELPPLNLVSTFPFGLIEVRRRLADARQIVVYPRVWPVRTVVLEQAQGIGDATRPMRGEGDEFFSLREYVPGDDPRQIAWRASGRLGSLMVRELHLDISRFALFVFDNRFRPEVEGFGEFFEEAIELVASLATLLLSQQYSVALVTASGYVPEGEGTAQQLKILDALARLGLASPMDPDPLAQPPELGESRSVRYFLVSPDPRDWGRYGGYVGARVLDPREVVYA